MRRFHYHGVVYFFCLSCTFTVFSWFMMPLSLNKDYWTTGVTLLFTTGTTTTATEQEQPSSGGSSTKLLPDTLFRPSNNSAIDQVVFDIIDGLQEAGCNYSSSTEMMKREYNDSSFLLLENEFVRKRKKHFVSVLGDYYHWSEDDDEEVSSASSSDPVPGGVAIFQNAFVQGDRVPVIFDCSSVYVPGSCKWQEATTKEASFDINRILQNMDDGENVIHLDTAVLIHQFWGYAYYHFMIEDVPRLAYVLDFLKANPDASILADHATTFRATMTLNQILGLTNQTTWVPYDTRKSYFVKNLLVPTGTRCGRAQPKPIEIIQALVDKYVLRHFPHSDVHLKHGQEKLILVQKRVRSRKVRNHPQLVATLKERFPVAHVAEFYGNESMIETVLLHHAADIVVGPHGGGLSNIIFTRRGRCGVVEMHPQYGNFKGTRVNECHQYTARAAGLETRLVVQTDGSHFGDFSVNITAVVETVGELLVRKSNKTIHNDVLKNSLF